MKNVKFKILNEKLGVKSLQFTRLRQSFAAAGGLQFAVREEMFHAKAQKRKEYLSGV